MQSKFIIESFWQRGANCGAVAYIKALLLKNGLKAGLTITLRPKQISVQLPDRTVLFFTRKEITEINKCNEISFRKYRTAHAQKKGEKIKFIVHILFAVLVKKIQSTHPGLKKAISVLTKEGIETADFHHYLGAKKNKVYRLTPRNVWRLKNKKSALLYNAKHIVAVSNGCYDNMGHAERIDTNIPLLLNAKATHWFEIK